MRYVVLFGCSVLFSLGSVVAQEYRSIHEVQSEEYGRGEKAALVQPETGTVFSPPLNTALAAKKSLTKHILGWNPYWTGTTYTSFDYSLLSTVAYFSYEVDTATGSYTTVRYWKTTDLISVAHEQGTRVVLTVTNFGNANNAAILNSSTKQKVLIDSLIALVKLRNADGVNIDFESITDKTLRPKLTTFMQNLANRFHTEIPGSQVSIALPAVDWSGIFDVQALGQVLDLCIMMGYDYHWSSAPQAGPVAPLDSSATWGKYSVLRSVRTYLAAGLPAEKLLLGVPYYGYEWKTETTDVPSNAIGSGQSVTYDDAVPRSAQNIPLWDNASKTPYYILLAGIGQGWYDDVSSLALKYDGVLQYGLGGVGIWALSYDGARPELWNLLRQKFTAVTSVRERETADIRCHLVSEGNHRGILCTTSAPALAELSLYDVMGRQLASSKHEVGRGTTLLEPVWLATMRHGVYMVRVRVGEQVSDMIVTGW